MNNIELAPEQQPSDANIEPVLWDVYIRNRLELRKRLAPVQVRARRWYDAKERVMSFYGYLTQFLATLEVVPSSPSPRGMVLVTLEVR